MLKNLKWSKITTKYKNGIIDIQNFVNLMKNETLYYSTPVGEDKDGKPNVYVLSNNESDIKYYPAFRTKEQCLRFFNALGRSAFIIIKGDLKSVLSSLDTSPIIAGCAVIIEPNTLDQFMIPPNIRVTK